MGTEGEVEASDEHARDPTPGAAACSFMTLAMPVRRRTEAASSTGRDDLVNPSGSRHRASVAALTVIKPPTRPPYSQYRQPHGWGWGRAAGGLGCLIVLNPANNMYCAHYAHVGASIAASGIVVLLDVPSPMR